MRLQLGAGGTSPLGGSFPGDDTELYWRVGPVPPPTGRPRASPAATGRSRSASARTFRRPFSYAAEVFWDGVTTTDLDPSLSALILRDEGRATAYGLGLSFAYDTRDGAGLLAPGTEMGASLRWAASPGGQGLDAGQPVGASLCARRAGRAEAGGIGRRDRGPDGGWLGADPRPRLTRRFGTARLRLRRASARAMPSLGIALGGTRFALASAEYLVPVRGKPPYRGLRRCRQPLVPAGGAARTSSGKPSTCAPANGLTVAWEGGNFGHLQPFARRSGIATRLRRGADAVTEPGGVVFDRGCHRIAKGLGYSARRGL